MQLEVDAIALVYLQPKTGFHRCFKASGSDREVVAAIYRHGQEFIVSARIGGGLATDARSSVLEGHLCACNGRAARVCDHSIESPAALRPQRMREAGLVRRQMAVRFWAARHRAKFLAWLCWGTGPRLLHTFAPPHIRMDLEHLFFPWVGPLLKRISDRI